MHDDIEFREKLNDDLTIHLLVGPYDDKVCLTTVETTQSGHIHLDRDQAFSLYNYLGRVLGVR